jgi:hypothetical protein
MAGKVLARVAIGAIVAEAVRVGKSVGWAAAVCVIAAAYVSTTCVLIKLRSGVGVRFEAPVLQAVSKKIPTIKVVTNCLLIVRTPFFGEPQLYTVLALFCADNHNPPDGLMFIMKCMRSVKYVKLQFSG